MISSPNAASAAPLILDITIVDETPSNAWRVDPQFQPIVDDDDSTSIEMPAFTDLELSFYREGPMAEEPTVLGPRRRALRSSRMLLAGVLAILGLFAGIAAALLS
jgi:hypothetical protein